MKVKLLFSVLLFFVAVGAQELSKKGIDPGRITCIGFSDRVKLVEEISPANQVINRSVEVVFIK